MIWAENLLNAAKDTLDLQGEAPRQPAEPEAYRPRHRRPHGEPRTFPIGDEDDQA